MEVFCKTHANKKLRRKGTQGSVKSQSYSVGCRILGPEMECALTDTELNTLPIGHHCFRSYRRVKAIIYNGHTIGSVLKHSNASNVIAKHQTDGIQVAQIQYFGVLKTKPTEARASEDVHVALSGGMSLIQKKIISPLLFTYAASITMIILN